HEGRRPAAYLTRSAYWVAVSSASTSPGFVGSSAMSQTSCGRALTCSGLSLSEALTSVTRPDTGEYNSETALTDSIVPNDSPCFSVRPTSGNSTYTTSPSCF